MTWAWLLLAAATAVADYEVEVQTTAGDALRGALVALSTERIRVRAAGEARDVALDDVLQLVPTSPAERHAGPATIQVRLVDGSELAATAYRVAAGEARLALAIGGEATVATGAIAWVRLVAPTDKTAPQWEQILGGDQAGDLLVVLKAESIDYVDGVLGDVSDELVEFKTDGERVHVKRAKVAGFVYSHPRGDELPAAAARVEDRAGSRIAAHTLRLAEDRLEIESPAGLKLAIALAELARIDFSQGKVVYLSDLDWDAEQSERTPYFGQPRPIDPVNDLLAPQRDRALDGGPLRLAGLYHAKGLALHSRTKLVYRLPPGFRRFTAWAGIDDRLEEQGQVRLEISGDAETLFEATLSGSDQPAPIDVDISGFKRLTIVVDFAADQDIADHLDLCDPRIVK